jgi:hypothetical protein
MKNLTLILPVLFFFYSCSNKDNTSPESVVLTPENLSTYIGGEDLYFSAVFSDNEALSEYKIDIHDAFDGHTHGKLIAAPWSLILINKLEGSRKEVELNISIPENVAAGPYHFMVYCVDMAGNQADFVERTIYLKNPEDTILPIVTVNTPQNSQQFTLGTPIIVNGTAIDNKELQKVEIKLRRLNASNFLFNQNFNLTGEFDTFEVEIPTTGISFTSGDYELYVIVYDKVFNTQSNKINIRLN